MKGQLSPLPEVRTTPEKSFSWPFQQNDRRADDLLQKGLSKGYNEGLFYFGRLASTRPAQLSTKSLDWGWRWLSGCLTD
jgi:hypothetical protein